MDGHAVIPDDYVRTAVETLRRTGADNVGGIMAARGTTAFEQAVAAAMSSPIGVGNAASTQVARKGRPRPSTWASSVARRSSGRVDTTGTSRAPRTGS